MRPGGAVHWGGAPPSPTSPLNTRHTPARTRPLLHRTPHTHSHTPTNAPPPFSPFSSPPPSQPPPFRPGPARRLWHALAPRDGRPPRHQRCLLRRPGRLPPGPDGVGRQDQPGHRGGRGVAPAHPGFSARQLAPPGHQQLRPQLDRPHRRARVRARPIWGHLRPVRGGGHGGQLQVHAGAGGGGVR